MNYLKRFDWTDKLLTETDKHAVENIVVEYHDIFARHRTDIGMNKEFKFLKWDSQQKMTKLFIAKTYRCRSTWKRTY